MEMPNLVTIIIAVILALIPGAIVGWLGSMIYKRSRLGLSGNIFMGIVGSIIGYTLVVVLRINPPTGFGAIIPGVIGAIVILLILNLIFKNK